MSIPRGPVDGMLCLLQYSQKLFVVGGRLCSGSRYCPPVARPPADFASRLSNTGLGLGTGEVDPAPFVAAASGNLAYLLVASGREVVELLDPRLER